MRDSYWFEQIERVQNGDAKIVPTWTARWNWLTSTQRYKDAVDVVKIVAKASGFITVIMLPTAISGLILGILAPVGLFEIAAFFVVFFGWPHLLAWFIDTEKSGGFRRL